MRSISRAKAFHVGVPLARARGACDGEAGLDERDAVEAGEPEGERLGAGRVAAGAQVGLEGVGLVRRAARELADADGGAAEGDLGVGESLGAEGVGPRGEALVVGIGGVAGGGGWVGG